MNASEILDAMARVGAMVSNSHIVYTSGRHGEAYVNKDALYPHTELTSQLCATIAERFLAADPVVVAAPALGGIILSQWTAHHLTRLASRPVLSIYGEKDPDGDFVIKRGYDQLLPGKRVLVVEDVLTTGGSVEKMVQQVRRHGGEVVGIGCLCNRGGLTAQQLGVPELFALTELSLTSWTEEECPLCKRSVPINQSVGKGLEFLKRLQKVS